MDIWNGNMVGDLDLVLSIGLRNTADFTYYLEDDNDRIELERTSSMKDLGVIIDCKLKFQDHIKEKI